MILLVGKLLLLWCVGGLVIQMLPQFSHVVTLTTLGVTWLVVRAHYNGQK